jgi:capsular polysaccharide biosynthesis protein
MNKSLRIYSWLLKLYPRSFLENFGTEMRQVFQAKYRAASRENRVAKLWLNTLIDLLSSTIHEHLDEFRTNMTLQSLDRRLSFGRLFVAIALSLFAFCVIATLFIVPRVYHGMTRIVIEPVKNPSAAAPAYDSYVIQTAVERIQSREILEPVARQMGHYKAFGQILGKDARRHPNEAIEMLGKMIDVRQIRNTALLEIRAYSSDPHMSAQIANEIAQVFKENQERRNSIYATSIVDLANPVERAVRPNIPLNVVVGFVGSIVIAVMLAVLIRAVFRLRTPVMT